MPTLNVLALDRSLRSFDSDGHMRVEESRISKANVCPYRGSEIPKNEELGLDPNRIYRLFRDPSELAKAAPTFVGKPLLIRHVAIDAEEPNQSLWVGTIGDVSFEHPYLIARPITVLTAEAISLIESGEQRELSSAYRYDAVMEPGTYDGESYDGRMVNIRGNHVAIVSEGRAGPDVLVADEAPPELRNMPLKNAALIKKLMPFLKENADLVAFDGALGETPAVSVISLSKDEMEEALDEYCAEKGMDKAAMDESEKQKVWDKAKDKKAKDKAAKDAAAMNTGAVKGADGDVDHRDDFKSGAKDQAITMDAMNAAIAAGVAEARRQERAAAVAREKVRPLVGAVDVAMDSADDIYRFALKHAQVKTEGIHPSALPALVDVVLQNKTARAAPAQVAMDAALADDFDSMFGLQ